MLLATALVLIIQTRNVMTATIDETIKKNFFFMISKFNNVYTLE